MKYLIAIFLISIFTMSCIPERRVVGTYGTEYGDTIRVVDDHSFRIELEEPDTVNSKQFKYTTGRWHKRGLKLELHVDSRSYGNYWECMPLKIGWGKLRRAIDCSGEGKNYVFRKVNYRKIQRIAKKEAKRVEKEKEEKEEEKIKARIRDLEGQSKSPQ